MMLRFSRILIFMLIISISNAVNIREHSLRHVHVLFRHGDRAPIEEHLKDNQSWPDALGMLTQVGIQQQFELGQWLRARYKDFLPKNYYHTDYHMRSTDVDRTLMSAMANMAGLYHNTKSPLRQHGVAWSPIPVHTVSEKNDILLAITECPRLHTLYTENMKSDKMIKLMLKHAALLATINEKTSLKYVDQSSIWKISDQIICMKSHNHTLPKWLTPQLANELIAVDKEIWRIDFGARDELLRLRIGVLLHSITDHLTGLIDYNDMRPAIHRTLNDNQEQQNAKYSRRYHKHHPRAPRMVTYSAHDTDVAPLLRAFDVHDGSPPPYAACVMIELLGPPAPAPRKEYRVRIVYKEGFNDTKGRLLQIPPCKDVPIEEGCPLPMVINFIQPLILTPLDVPQACDRPVTIIQYIYNVLNMPSVWATCVLVFSFVLVFILMTYTFIFACRRWNGYNRLADKVPLVQ